MAKEQKVTSAETALRALKAEHETNLEALRKEAAPLRAKLDAIYAKQGELDAELAPLLDEYRPYKQRMADLENEIGRVSRNLPNARSTSDAA